MEGREKRNAKQSENIFKERSIRLHGLLYEEGVCKGGWLCRPKMGTLETFAVQGRGRGPRDDKRWGPRDNSF